jgi:uncharacterized delta-60 repeat protein
MKKVRKTSLFIYISFLVLCSVEGAKAQSRDDYLINAGNQQLVFVRQPERGYVVQSQKTTTAIESLEGILKQFGARDIRPVRGLGRKGVSVVYSKRTRGENENVIAQLKAHGLIKYAAPLFSSNGETVAIIPEIVVHVRAGTQGEQIQRFCQTINLAIKKRLDFTEREYLIETPATDADGVFTAVEELGKADFVEWAVPNVAFRPQLLGQVIPNDTYFANQWHLNNTGQSGGTAGADINAPEAWEITTGDPNIIVAVLDQGVDTNHPDLVNNIVAGYDFYDGDSTPDPSGNDAHGTACAGLVAAQGNNGLGVTGVAWHCKIMPVRIVGPNGFVTTSDIATAFRWAANHGADVMSNSWGSTSALPVIYSAIQDVTVEGGIGRDGKGCVVLAASGNWANGGSVVYPAKYPEVIAVGATDHNDVVWYYSGSGPELDIVAPSGKTNLNGDIWTTDIAGSAGYNNRTPGILDYTDKMGGTSAACPIAAGIAALILSLDPNLTNFEVQDILQASAVDLIGVDFDSYYGHGRVDARSAVDLVQVLPKTQWVAHYNGPGNSYDVAIVLTVDNSGNVYVTGYSYGSGTNYDYATIKYDPNGNQLWVRRYDDPGNGDDKPWALAVDGSGNVCVTGYSYGSDTNYDYATIKYEPNGNQLWAARYNNSLANSSDKAWALTVDNSGNVYVTGESTGSGTGLDYATIKYDPNGNQLWAARYNNWASSSDKARALTVDNSGNVYVTGESYGSGTNYDYATVKYDPNGNQLWAISYNNSPANSSDKALALTVDNSGNVYVTGESTGSGTGLDYATIKYDPNGNQLWVARYNGPIGNGDDKPYSLAIDGSGNIYVTGSSISSGTNYDFATIKYDPNGNQLWVKRYNGSGGDWRVSLAVDASGSVYVTGSSYSASTEYDYATIKYGPNGNLLWVKHYNGPIAQITNHTNSLTVDSFGNVYVTGYSYGNGIYDYATVKYSQQNYCTAAIDGDLNDDCKVDFKDFAILAEAWLEGKDWLDVAQLCNDWLECRLAYQGGCW